jgi:hypothetical protein
MSQENTRLAALTASVLAQIEGQFEEVNEDHIRVMSPISDRFCYDVLSDDPGGTHNVSINGEHDALEPHLRGLPSMLAAKTAIANIIAEEILKAETILIIATSKNLTP